MAHVCFLTLEHFVLSVYSTKDVHFDRLMKYTDDYHAKIKIWALESKVIPLPDLPRLPRFSPQRFDSYEALMAWKRKLILKMASLS